LVIKAINTRDVPVVQFLDFVNQFAIRQTKELKKEIDYMLNENAGLISPQVLVELMKSLFEEEVTALFSHEPQTYVLRHLQPYRSRGFILEGFPRSKMEAETLIKSGYHVDVCVVMKIDDDVAVRRYLRINKESIDDESVQVLSPILY
jgi:adenylate kinase family enzyme